CCSYAGSYTNYIF
nr:immunoglobulin light chain junction region [Macaca mulatta]